MKKTSVAKMVFALYIFSVIVCALSACAVSPYPYALDEFISVPSNWTEMHIKESEISLRVKDMIQQARENAAITETVISRASEEGDLIEVSLVCYKADEYGKGGVKIDLLSDDNCAMIIGEGKYPRELESAMSGRYSGDGFAVRLTLPENYTVSGFAGMAVVYEVSVNNVTEFRLPLYNDAFVQTVSGCESVAEYEETLYEIAKEDLVWETIFRSSEVKVYPEEELSAHIGDYVTYYTNLAEEQNLTLEQYVGKKFFISLTDFHKEAETNAKETVKRELLMYYFERKYDLGVSDAEYSEMAKKYANETGCVTVAALEEKFGREYVQRTVQYDKVLAYVAQNVNIVEDIV